MGGRDFVSSTSTFPKGVIKGVTILKLLIYLNSHNEKTSNGVYSRQSVCRSGSEHHGDLSGYKYIKKEVHKNLPLITKTPLS